MWLLLLAIDDEESMGCAGFREAPSAYFRQAYPECAEL